MWGFLLTEDMLCVCGYSLGGLHWLHGRTRRADWNQSD